MSTYDWTETTWRERTSTGAVLETETDNAVIRFHLEDRDGEVRPAFTVETGGQSYTTDDPEDWPTIERFVPRTEWPEPMYAGKRGPKARTPDRAIVEAVRVYEAELAQAATDADLEERAVEVLEEIEDAAQERARAREVLEAAVRRGIDLGLSDRVLAAASGWSRSTVRRLRGHDG